MKNCLSLCIALASALSLPLAATEIAVSTQASNFGFDDDGNLNPDTPRFGASVSVSDRISNRLDGTISFGRDPLGGNLLAARASWRTTFMEISAGPSFGILNSGEDKKDLPVLFQPGLGVGFKILIPGYFIASADTDFALPPVSALSGQIFLQRSELSAGFYLPNVLCTAKISQRTNTLALDWGSRVRSVTDYGLYTESFKKGAPYRISVDFVYRIQDFYLDDASAVSVKIGNLVLGGGVTWAPNSTLSLYAKGAGALYSFSLGEKVDDLDKFMYEVSLGAKFITNTPKGID